jgi:phosphohistidine phosphatase
MTERKLFIIRHGKSSWDYDDLDDIDRPLADRGLRNADTMAHRLLKKGDIPELIYSSPANRALNTALIMSRIWKLGPDQLQIQDVLYMAYVSEIHRVVGSAPDQVKRLAIFGHNPTFTMYANTFLADPLENLPTAGTVVVYLQSESWKGIDRSHVKHAEVDYPKRK